MTMNQSNPGTQTAKDADYLPVAVKSAFLELQFRMGRNRIEKAINFAYGALVGQKVGQNTERYIALRQETLESLNQQFEISDEQSNAILLLAAWRVDHEMRERDR
jgi:hypothetical protein